MIFITIKFYWRAYGHRRKKVIMTHTNAMAQAINFEDDVLDTFELFSTLNADEIKKMEFPIKVYNLHKDYLFGGPSGKGKKDVAAVLWRYDHNILDLNKEAVGLARKICYLNRVCRLDPAIDKGFLDRKYNIVLNPDGSNTNEVVSEAKRLIKFYEEIVSKTTFRIEQRNELTTGGLQEKAV